MLLNPFSANMLVLLPVYSVCTEYVSLVPCSFNSPFPFSFPMGFDLTSASSEQELLINEAWSA